MFREEKPVVPKGSDTDKQASEPDEGSKRAWLAFSTRLGRFKRPVGAAADARELEYVSALHQATLEPRKNNSIAASDIAHFLLSRYGIVVTPEEVTETVMKGLGGGTDEEELVDIAELVAILIIPYLRGTSAQRTDSGEGASVRSVSYGTDKDMSPYDVVQFVAEMIMGDVMGDVAGASSAQVIITHDFIKQILVTYGEEDLAEDEKLVQEMFIAATGGMDDVVFGSESFVKALSSDIDAYNIDDEAALTTNYQDVFPKAMEGSTHAENDSTHADVESSKAGNVQLPKKSFTAEGIDSTAETYRSRMFVIALWAFFIMTIYTYLPNPLEDETDCGGDISYGEIVGCRVKEWFFIAVAYCLLGTVFIGLGSLGNSLESDSVWPSIVSILSMAIAAFAPFIVTTAVTKSETTSFKHGITLVLGICLVALQIFYLVGKRCQETVIHKNQTLEKLFLSLHSGNVISESMAKQAAVYKTKALVENALKLHDDIDEIDFTREKCYSRALLNYGKSGEEYKKCGGFLWTWRLILSGKIMTEEGLWLPSLVLAANFLQLIISGLIVTVGLRMTDDLIGLIEEGCSYDRAQALLNQTNSDQYCVTAQDAVWWAGRIASVICIIVCLMITSDYIPSTVKTMMQFRSGKIPFASSKRNFLKYKIAPDTVSKVAGGMFWAVFFAGLAAYFLYGVILFLCIWEPTQKRMVSFAAQMIGALIPLLLKLLVLLCFRRLLYAGLYRGNPRNPRGTEVAKSNFLLLALQCLDYAQAFWYMIGRTAKLLIYASFYVGRIDTPFFAPEVGSYGAFDIDGSPTIYRRLLAAHEAHRHPFIESLGKIYLLKLRHKDEFGKISGSRWRLIFVSALMPWLRKYRVAIDYDDPSHVISGRWSRQSTRRVLADINDLVG